MARQEENSPSQKLACEFEGHDGDPIIGTGQYWQLPSLTALPAPLPPASSLGWVKLLQKEGVWQQALSGPWRLELGGCLQLESHVSGEHSAWVVQS
ncbi:hypothetical protein MDA_GLEAN10017215 [Myotis davidii]|uniref:Uncharacterized protein n=1 Tax=Myotis davidii TaxID=225400 RepID=L5LXP0_MYODS|nr:hypothetical protein MDA_GLEAN10017215 [Myotis davidii]